MSNDNSIISQKAPAQQEQAPQADVLAEHAELIRRLGKRMIADVIEIGRRLSECKRLLGHGNWLPWINREFRWTERTARNFVSAYEFASSKSANVADLTITVSSFYLLAAASTPEEARAEVVRRAEAGEALPHAEVKRIVGEAKGHSSITVREMIRGYYGDFARLPPIEREKILEERPENIDFAIADAATRQRWKPPYCQLQNTLVGMETAAKWSARKIIDAIPAEHIAATTPRIEQAIRFLSSLDAKLRHNRNVSKVSTDDPKKRLMELIKNARKALINKYGRADYADVLETIWLELDATQIQLLLSGRLGPIIKTMTERLMEAGHGFQEKRTTRRG